MPDDGKRVRTQERRAAREQIEEDRAETVDIGGGFQLRGGAARLFGRDVAGRAENRQRARQIAGGVEPFGQAEIADERFAMAVEQDVSRFEIAMEDAFAMRVLHGPRDLGDERDALPRLVPQRGTDLLQTSARREFHAEERKAVFALAHFVDRQNVRMIEARGGLRFAPEARQGFAGVGVIPQDPLHGDDAAGMALARAIDHAHAAAPNFLQDLIIAESPLGVSDINFVQHRIERFGTLDIRVEAALEQTAET